MGMYTNFTYVHHDSQTRAKLQQSLINVSLAVSQATAVKLRHIPELAHAFVFCATR